MAWTELHDTLPDHPKTKLLMAEIGSTKAHAVGLLCALWCFALRYGKEGKISMAYWRAFAADMGEKDPDGTLAALRSSGWVDSNGDGSVTCHDWDDYAGRLEDYRKANRERQRRHRLKMHDVTPDNGDVTRDVTPCSRESHTTVPTQHNQPTTTALSDESDGDHEPTPAEDRFARFWEFFPRKIGKGKAWASFKRLKAEDQNEAIEQAEAYGEAYDMAPDHRRQYFKHPTTWINSRSWEDDHAEWSLLIEGK